MVATMMSPAPPARYAHTVTYSPSLDALIVFGGYGGEQMVFADLYLFIFPHDDEEQWRRQLYYNKNGGGNGSQRLPLPRRSYPWKYIEPRKDRSNGRNSHPCARYAHTVCLVPAPAFPVVTSVSKSSTAVPIAANTASATSVSSGAASPSFAVNGDNGDTFLVYGGRTWEGDLMRVLDDTYALTFNSSEVAVDPPDAIAALLAAAADPAVDAAVNDEKRSATGGSTFVGPVGVVPSSALRSSGGVVSVALEDSPLGSRFGVSAADRHNQQQTASWSCPACTV